MIGQKGKVVDTASMNRKADRSGFGKATNEAPNGAVEDPRRGVALSHHEEYYYEFLGECCINGMMDGEAVARRTEFMECMATEVASEKEHVRGEQKREERFWDTVFELR